MKILTTTNVKKLSTAAAGALISFSLATSAPGAYAQLEVESNQENLDTQGDEPALTERSVRTSGVQTNSGISQPGSPVEVTKVGSPVEVTKVRTEWIGIVNDIPVEGKNLPLVTQVNLVFKFKNGTEAYEQLESNGFTIVDAGKLTIPSAIFKKYSGSFKFDGANVVKVTSLGRTLATQLLLYFTVEDLPPRMPPAQDIMPPVRD
jgi:hypothetical protein